MHIVTRGLVLREVAYKEADKILTVLTEEGGKRTVKARGCRRKGSRLAAAAQLLVWSEMTLFAYRDHLTMNEAAPLEQFWGVREDIEKLALKYAPVGSIAEKKESQEKEPGKCLRVSDHHITESRLKGIGTEDSHQNRENARQPPSPTHCPR